MGLHRRMYRLPRSYKDSATLGDCYGSRFKQSGIACRYRQPAKGNVNTPSWWPIACPGVNAVTTDTAPVARRAFKSEAIDVASPHWWVGRSIQSPVGMEAIAVLSVPC